jgi:hypothetical protein
MICESWLCVSHVVHVFHKIFSTTQFAKQFYHYVHIYSPFDNEHIKPKPREVDAMHEIKISVVRRLYQQILKSTILNMV